MNAIILLSVVLLISILFFTMIRRFLMVIMLAGIFSALVQPIYKQFLKYFKGRQNLSSGFTLVFVMLIFVIPLIGLLGVVASQAIKISQTVRPWISQRIKEPTAFDEFFQSLPFYDTISPYKNIILQKAGELVGKMSNVLFESVSSVTISTVNFIFLFFVFLYTMFFFLKEGRSFLDKGLYYLPLTSNDEHRMLDKFTSVTRATIKGTLLIGVIQGSLAGVAFWVVGIESAVFWGTVMTVLSVIPAVGSALIWFPAVILLAASGAFVKAIGLWIFCGLLVGSVDNVLRPRFVGRDTKMHELLIFFSTLGGLSLFGIVGFIIGPIIAALFVTAWDIYGETFQDYLPDIRPNEEDDPEKILLANNPSSGERESTESEGTLS
ncbi:MAG: AI-2E family transporter [candidate division KSB1 bacterium]|jgi:predicted PurR-regulated permease PerM|nr:AI-2E family transporter [candidate division KSB1 bacterium]